MNHADALKQLARETKRARSRLRVERMARTGLPLVLAAGAWAALAMAGLLDALPPLAESLAALAALIGLAILFLRARRAYAPPTDAEARARLAADSALEAGAFEALEDRPSKFDPLSLALWRREQDLARGRLQQAKAGPARPGLNRLDPWRLRFVVLAGLIATALLAGLDAPDRLARGFLPDPGPLLGDKPMAVEAWVAPADYTRAPPISLSDSIGGRVETPPSIEATVRVTGPTGAPLLVFEGQGGRRTARFARAADGAWEAKLAIPGEGRLKIVRFHTRAHWRLAPAPDNAPSARFSAPIASLDGERVGFSWAAEDDFGLTRLMLRVRPIDPPPGLRGADPVDTPLEAPAGAPRLAEAEAELDLATHPYTGMEVEARIVAIDALGQAGASAAQRFTLPEKIFLQKLAQAAIEIRREILWERRAYRPAPRDRTRTIQAGDILLGNQRIEIRDRARRPNLERAPAGIGQAVTLLDALTMAPDDGYFADLAVFLGLKLARAELSGAEQIEHTDLAAATLWSTALRAEYGGAADARRALEAAQRALADALQSGAPQERIRALNEALRRATEAYLQALVQEAIRAGQTQQSQEDTEETAQLSERDIEDLLNQVQRLSEQGRTEEAQAMLQQLAGLLSNLDVQLSEGGDSQSGEQGGEDGEQQQQLQQSMDALSQSLGEQRELREATEQQEQQQEQQQQNSSGGSGGQQEGGAGGGELANRQAQLREALGEARSMAEQAGASAAEDIDAAGQAMQEAEGALRAGDYGAARAAQDAAMRELREGAEKVSTEMRRNAQNDNRQGAPGPRDPLGRTAPGAGMGEGETNVPSEFDPVRAREIRDEIRRRAQDPNRPEAEREYLRRLLDRFSGS